MVYNPATNAGAATPISSFEAHVNGTAFNQGAASITTSPGINGAIDLQTSLNNVQTFINASLNNGLGLVAVSETYNCYHAGVFDNAIPSLDSLLIPIFTAIINNTTIPAGYTRLKDGGILFIPAGSYYIQNTITIPPGITILGEGFGTKIVNATRLNIASSPPAINSGLPVQPMFNIARDTTRTNPYSVDYGVNSSSGFIFSRAARLMNLLICDNLAESATGTDSNYALPQTTSGVYGLVQQFQGSSLEVENVKFLGRVETTTAATQFAISLDAVTTVTTGTYLKVCNSFIDGFHQPISFTSKGGIKDYLEVSNCKIRAHGYLSGDASSPANNCMILSNDNNSRIVSNDFFGESSGVNTILYLLNSVGGTPALQSISKVLIASNTVVIARGSGTSIVLNDFQTGISSLGTYATVMSYGNDFQDSEGFRILATDGGSTTSFNLDSSEVIIDSASITNDATTITNVATNFDVSSDNFSTSVINTSISSTTLDIVSNNFNTSGTSTTIISDTIMLGNSTVADVLETTSTQVIIHNGLPLSFGPTPSDTGRIRLQSGEMIGFRNNAGTNDINLIKSSSVDQVVIGDSSHCAGVNLETTNQISLLAGSETQIFGGSQFISVPSSGSATMTDISGNALTIGQITLVLNNPFTNTSNVAASSNLTFPVAAGDRWHIKLEGIGQVSTTNGFKIAVSIPSGAAISGYLIGLTGVSFTSFLISGSGLVGSITSTEAFQRSPLILFADVKMDGTHSGNITIQIAPTTNGDTATLLATSTLTAYQVNGV